MSVATCDRVRSHLRTHIHIYGLLSALAHTLRVPQAAQPTAGRTGRRPQFRLLAKYIHKTVRTDTDRARCGWLLLMIKY